MNVAKRIRQKIEQRGPDSLWNFADFKDLPQQATAKTLSRLVKDGLIIRLRKGLYYFPKMTAIGLSRPSTDAILSKTLSHGKNTTIFSGGTASFQNLGITTQIPSQYTILSNQASRKIKIGNINVKIVHRSFEPNTTLTQADVWLLDAIRNLKNTPDSTPFNAIHKIISSIKLTQRPLKKLLRQAIHEPPRVRAILGAIAELLGYRGSEINTLRNSLNPLTKFHFGISKVLPNAHHWGID